jgi:serine/threonine protein kinase
MSTNDSLAKWGEPPASHTEELQAELLQELLAELCRTREIDPTAIPTSDAHFLVQSRQPLFETMTWVSDLAASIHENSLAGETVDVPLPDPFPGEFGLRKMLAEGAYGKVWLADDLQIIGRQVALKMLKPSSETGRDVIAALRSEAHLLDSVHHPNVVRIYSVRQSGDEYYLVLQYLAGGSLAARLKQEGSFPWQEACRYIADVGEALLHMHARGIIHRDVKPANILWDPETDDAVLTDFGGSCRLTEPGLAGGTIPYLAPEAFTGQVTPALDVFALAATLFHLATGEVPFPANDEIEHTRKVLVGLPDPDPRCTKLPAPIEQLIRRGLSSELERRPDLEGFVGSLRGCLNRLLAANLCVPAITGSGTAPVDIRILASRDSGNKRYVPLTASEPERIRQERDLKREPPAPEKIRVHTGDRIRVHLSVDRAGYVALFNIGPTGNVHILEPEANSEPCWLEANRPLEVLQVEVTPPPGCERLVATWSREPLHIGKLLRLTGQHREQVSAPYQGTRDLQRVDKSVRELRREDWHAVILELDHEK